MGLFFLNFLAYLIVFVIIGALAFAAIKVGIAWRKKDDAKAAAEAAAASAEETTEQ